MTGSSPGKRVELPRDLKHGSLTAYNWPHCCRCKLCRARRAEYERNYRLERVHPDWRPNAGRAGWFVCTDGFDGVYAWHAYENDVCARCGTDRATEDYWEQRWKESTS